ncbi:MAG: tRNA guanosine(34) transglycosylase Tgt [Planctomycetes bacterium]|nr:tRNA guanosine(34) transglycosylase Tgt [Planctomycetota bacterium]
MSADANPWTPGGGLRFQLLAQSGNARRGRFFTAHGPVDTPAFMPVGTQAAVKCAFPGMVADTGAQVVLANTYHMANPERVQLAERHGGLHGLMRWDRSILTDSGGFQVFSLPERQITEEGVRFRFQQDDQPTLLTPESSMDTQKRLGADIVMAFDECVAHDAPASYVADSLGRTERWLKRCVAVPLQEHQHLFGIVQGGMDLALRSRAVGQVAALGLPGIAIGGVSVGEGHQAMVRVVRHTAPLLPADRPRYLMGVGLPEDLVASVEAGMDIHDCVIPTRYAREGTAFTWDGKMRIQDKKFRKDRYPIDTQCGCPACAGGFSRSYIRHLLFAGETLGEMLMTLHNLHFYQKLMQAMREAIEADRFAAWAGEFRARYLARREG